MLFIEIIAKIVLAALANAPTILIIAAIFVGFKNIDIALNLTIAAGVTFAAQIALYIILWAILDSIGKI